MIYITQVIRGQPLTRERVIALMRSHTGPAAYVTDDAGNRFLMLDNQVYPVRECTECGRLVVGETAIYCEQCLSAILKADDGYYSIDSCILMLEYFMFDLRRSAENGDRDALKALSHWADELIGQ